MTGPNEHLYEGKEQTLVKHSVLRTYIERFAHIVGMRWDTITYVDCFSGPWNAHSDQLDDSSFSIALKELCKAKTNLATIRTVSLRCFFLEQDSTAYTKLKQFADDSSDAEIMTRNAKLEDSVDDIIKFVSAGGPSSFPFILLDPFGWRVIPMDLIKPLLCFQPGEVLITFMTGHISRFVEAEADGIRKSFDRLFGHSDYLGQIADLEGLDREDKIVSCYAETIRSNGRFEHVCTAIVLYPQKDRTCFHLIYATRHLKGVVEFKKAEKKAMEVMEKSRAEAQQRERKNTTGQFELFPSEQMHDPEHYTLLRKRHLDVSHADFLTLLRSQHSTPYDEIWTMVMTHPLVWDSDVKQWIECYRKEGILEIEGLSERGRVPKLGENHLLIWDACKDTSVREGRS